MEKIDKLIYRLLHDSNFALIPHNPNSDYESIELFNFFLKLETTLIYNIFLQYHNLLYFESALNTIKHYKGMFDYFDDNLDFEIYQKIENYLSADSIKKYNEHFYKNYAEKILTDKIKNINDDLLNIILNNDISLYIKVSKKLNIKDAAKNIFEKSPLHIFEWINASDDIYSELLSINKHDFILSNMNGNLNISDDTLKYIIDHTEPNLELFLSIKHKIGLSKLWELSNHKLNPEFYAHLIENLNDLFFVINIDNITLNSLETILNNIKIKFPLLYDNFNSLLFVKKEFQ